MAENENLASILVKSGLISIFTNSPIGYFSKFANEIGFLPSAYKTSKTRFYKLPAREATQNKKQHFKKSHSISKISEFSKSVKICLLKKK